MKATMKSNTAISKSADGNVKPPRPCTEYNLFFQLERAYILQVLLRSEPGIDDPSDVFRPTQESYIGLPALPQRYASLVLPYDWHLPGKEQRRKRKHRKSHGAIGFHELSNMIASAWKAVDDEVKAYCSKVCSVGMARYKTAMKEWKKNGGQQPVPKHKKRLGAKQAKSADKPKKSPDVSDSNQGLAVLLNNLARNENVIPSRGIAQEVSRRELDQVFENDIDLEPDEDVLGMLNMGFDFSMNLPSSNNDVQSTIEAGANCSDNTISCEAKALRQVSFVTNELNHVDIDDHEIFSMWATSDADLSNNQHSNDCPSALPMEATSNDMEANSNDISYLPQAKEKTDQLDCMFGLKGYNQMMEEMQRMQLLLEQQMVEIGKTRPPMRRLSIVACSA